MLKIIFFLLLLANGVLFAFHQGYLESVTPGGHEPERMKNQLNADKIRLIATPVQAGAPPQQALASAEPAAPRNTQAVFDTACIEIGTFTALEARRFEAQLAALPLAGKPARLDVTESSSHMVLIPPQGDKAGADKKVAELRTRGVTDYYVLQGTADPDLRWGVSLGIFRSENAAKAYLEQVSQKGVRSARLVAYKAPMRRFAFRVSADTQARSGIEKLKTVFPNQQLRDCPVGSAE
jgi:hypothetical protein